MITLNIEQIKEAILQRDPMLMVDEITEIDPGKRVVGLKHITGDESFFKGHFPGEPIMPGTMIIEAMAQVSTFLFYEPSKKTQKLNFYLGVVKDIRFLKPVLPKAELKMVAEPLRLGEDSAHVKVEASVNGEIISKGELIFVRRKS